MSSTNASFIKSKAIETVETKQYTSDGVKTLIDKFDVYNSTAATITLSVRLVPVGGTAGPLNTIVSTPILAGKTEPFREVVAHTLESGEFISTLPTAAGLVLRASGRQVT